MGKGFEADYTDVKPMDGMFVIEEPGPFLARITKATPTTSRSGLPMVCVDYILVGGKYAGKEIMFQNICFLPKEHKFAGISIGYLKQLREPYEGKFTITPDDWVDKHILVFLKVEEYDGKRRNSVARTQAPAPEDLIDLGEKPAPWQLPPSVKPPITEALQTAANAAANSVETNGKRLKAKAKPVAKADEDEEVPF